MKNIILENADTVYVYPHITEDTTETKIVIFNLDNSEEYDDVVKKYKKYYENIHEHCRYNALYFLLCNINKENLYK